ncbi:hypothetical protein CF8_1113 [Nocardioides sp. CF8]|uniref:DUF2304 domain-containing protein n=1 Tax=Nocardioides sp. CF8 TaxID=110319 RepID=UPI0003313B10|nr:DUF2304 domain-containing protein [Nocardioides sp. CF8]EON24844.1 hypothetical protein CF8_1113 [Nocardioides sp. CF8]
MTSANVLGLAAAIIVVVTLFEMLRRHRLREKYALIWFVLAMGSLVIAAFPAILFGLSDLLNVQVPSNLIFFIASLLLLAMSLQHSFEIGKLEERTRTLAEEIALLRLNADATQRPTDQIDRSDQ